MSICSETIRFPGPRDSVTDFLLRAIADGNPVLLEGPIGCGKTSVVRFAAKSFGEEVEKNLIVLQMSEDMDGKVRMKVN